jgi:hypothetical protein
MYVSFLEAFVPLHLWPEHVRGIPTAGPNKTSLQDLQVFVNVRWATWILLEKYFDLIVLGTLVSWFSLHDLNSCQEFYTKNFSGAEWEVRLSMFCSGRI